MDDIRESTRLLRKKSFFYTRLLKTNVIKITDEERAVAKHLEFEKFCIINDNYVHLNNFCDEPSYLDQRRKNERRYKSIVIHIRFDDEGNRTIVKRLFFPFHQSKKDAFREFQRQNPSCICDENNILEMQYIDSLKKEVWTV